MRKPKKLKPGDLLCEVFLPTYDHDWRSALADWAQRSCRLAVSLSAYSIPQAEGDPLGYWCVNVHKVLP